MRVEGFSVKSLGFRVDGFGKDCRMKWTGKLKHGMGTRLIMRFFTPPYTPPSPTPLTLDTRIVVSYSIEWEYLLSRGQRRRIWPEGLRSIQ